METWLSGLKVNSFTFNLVRWASSGIADVHEAISGRNFRPHPTITYGDVAEWSKAPHC